MPKKTNKKGSRNRKNHSNAKRPSKVSSQSVTSKLKQQGNAAFQNDEFMKAIALYSEAIELDRYNHQLFSNRSAAYNCCGEYDKALDDADDCIELKPNWYKGYLRKATALLSQNKFKETQIVYLTALSNCDDKQQIQQAILASEKNRNIQIRSAHSENMKKTIRFKDEYIVRGYLRELSNASLWEKNVPPLVNQLCLCYYDAMGDKWDTKCKHKSILIYGTNCSYIKIRSDKRLTTYCRNTISTGMHAWIFNIITYDKGAIQFGVWKSKSGKADTNTCIFYTRPDNAYGYTSDMKVLSNGNEYGQYCEEGDEIVMILDMFMLTLSYIHNGIAYGVAFNVEKTEYKAAVSAVCGRGTVIQLRSAY